MFKFSLLDVFWDIFFFHWVLEVASCAVAVVSLRTHSGKHAAPKTAELWDRVSSKVHRVSREIVPGDGASGSIAAKLKKFEKSCSGIQLGTSVNISFDEPLPVVRKAK